jgi:hypothetical protein
VCEDGQSSGEHCGDITALNHDESYYDNGTYLATIFHQTEMTGADVTQGGDSGGPVYTEPTDLDGLDQNVAARGMITGGYPDGTVEVCLYSEVSYIVGGNGPFQDNLTIVTN